MNKSKKALSVIFMLCLIIGIFTAVSMSAGAEEQATETTAAEETEVVTPEITELVSDESGITIKWSSVDGAAAYRVYYMTANGWKQFSSDVKGSTSKLDSGVVYGRAEQYTVRALDSNGNFIGSYNSDGWKTTYGVATPQITSLVSDENGINITWKPVDGASTYRVYYMTTNGWKRFASDVKGTTKLDSGVLYNRAEQYTVRAINKKGEVMSGYKSDGWKTAYSVAAPQITSLTSNENGINIKWEPISGVSTYRVYYMTTNGWKRFASDVKGTTKLDSGVVYNRTEQYTIRAINKKGEVMSGFKSDGWKTTYSVAAPQITSLTSDKNGINIKWEPVSGVSTYRVYYMTTNGWKRFASDVKGTSKLDTGVVYNRAEQYTIRAINKKGEVMSGYKSAGWKTTYAAATPQITNLTSTSSGVKITWSPISGISTYRVYYKNSSGSWERFSKDVTGTTMTDTEVQSDKTETYTVRALNTKATPISGYKSSGWSITYSGSVSNNATVKLPVRRINLPVSGTFKLEAYTPGASVSKNITWKSSNTSVATVSGSQLNATITAKKSGKASITVTLSNGSKAVCTVDVTTTKTSDSLKNQINSLPLYPVKTGYVALDNKVESIFKQIFKSGYTTYDKVKAVYDYEINNFSYDYISMTSQQEKDFYNNSKNSPPVSYYDSMIASEAYATLMNKKGVCYNYAAVFTVMMRAIGLECFSIDGTSTYADGHWGVHTWNNIIINGRYILFDAQVDDNIYNKLGYMLYDRFGMTDSESKTDYKYESSNRFDDLKYFNYFD